MANRECIPSADLQRCFATPLVVRGYQSSGVPFEESTSASIVSADGGSVELKTPVRDQQLLLLKNQKTGEERVCCVAAHGGNGDRAARIKVRFLEPSPSFWGFALLPNPLETAEPFREEYPQV